MNHTMIYGTPQKGDDGFYHAKVRTDDNKRCYVQVKNLKVVDVSSEVTFDLTDAKGLDKIENIHANNIRSAAENSLTWFGKNLQEKAIEKIYTKEDTLSAERISATKVFDSRKELVDFEVLTPGTECSVMLEYSGLWFAKKAFGPTWNLVQVKINPPPTPEPEPEPEPEPTPDPEPEIEAYPDDFVMEDDE